jgi:hypothetical protein
MSRKKLTIPSEVREMAPSMVHFITELVREVNDLRARVEKLEKP